MSLGESDHVDLEISHWVTLDSHVLELLLLLRMNPSAGHSLELEELMLEGLLGLGALTLDRSYC